MTDHLELSNAPATTISNAAQHTANRPSRNRRRGRGTPRSTEEDRSGPSVQERTVAGGRAFRGQLTRSLHADAPTFVPASVPPPSANHPSPQNPRHRPPSQKPQPTKVNPHPDSTPKALPHPKRRASLLRSTAPDITTRTHEDIAKGVYECAICTNEVSRNSKVWSCRTCWTVFHIGCIKKWSKNEGSAMQRPTNEDASIPVQKQWRCPGCNLPKDDLPSAYTCWCEKELDPKIIGGLPPHSCGQTCGKTRTFPKPCPHPCDLICHSGPCPPCSHMGPVQSCFCGKNSTSRKCTETNYETGWSCDSVCGDVMPCGDHTCPRLCHEGLCGACETEVDSRCYCGKVEKKLKCCDKEEERESYAWTGSFDCQQSCGRLMDCKEHGCEKQCHPQDEVSSHCPRSPDMVTHCPCGKTRLQDIAGEDYQPRNSCKDPIPNCKEACGKQLPCGHQCTAICHSGNCLPCLLTVSITCRCGRNSFNTICHQGNDEPPQCLRICKANLNCGRHECGERCCTGERKAFERQATKRKLKPLGAANRIDEGIEAEHICTRSCGRPLKCGNHTCTDLCHKGPCRSCKEAIFEDISCNCGRTVLQAPLPCGTNPPPCNFPCQRPKACGHPQVSHNCHTEEECPKCPFLTEKPCLCGKKTLKNQPCWRSDVLCGLVCGKKLKCGSHLCQKLCHRPGECEDAHATCQQMCGKPKKSCGHPCDKPCHAPSACKEDKQCPFKIMITCDCQRKKEEVRCNARVGAPDSDERLTSLKCDEECARLERNRSLALALNISDAHTDDHVPYSTTTLKLYLEDIAWSHKQEEILRLFAADDTEKRLRFGPMKSRQRAFIHSAAEDFGFDGESIDPEPHRHVLLFKTPKFVAAPMKTLAQAARIKRATLNVSAPVTSVPDRKADEARHDYNGFLLSNPKFALTEEELSPHISKAAPTTDFDVVFLHSSDSIALLPSNFWEGAEQLTTLLLALHPTLSAEIVKHKLAGSATLALFDTAGAEPRLLRQQGGRDSISTDGWSQVAAKRAAPAQAPQVKAVGQRPMYTVLGSKLAEAKRKKIEHEEHLRKLAQEQEVAENWEDEVEFEKENDKQAADEIRSAGNVSEKNDVVEVA